MTQKIKQGDIVRLIHTQGLHVPNGTLGVVVSPSQFPIYLAAMYRTMDRDDVHKYFIAIEWFAAISTDLPENGFYSKDRFEKEKITTQA